jgi:hypothetical protein
MFAKELGKRLQGTGITTYTVNPGGVHTPMAHRSAGHILVDFPYKEYLVKMILPWILRSTLQGAQTILYCCLEESIKHSTGGYYCTMAKKQPSNYALIESDQNKLWNLSEELTNCKNAQL